MSANLQADLEHFRGGDVYYRHWTRRLKYTEGVKYLAERAGAYWLIDAIASYQSRRVLGRHPRLREFQLWELSVDRDKRPMARLTCREDSGETPVVRQRIEYTDFPIAAIKLYVEGDVLLLPTEH